MELKAEGDRHIVVSRRFAAEPERVYRAHIEPNLIQQWLLGPEGWRMPVCISEPRSGGKIRYEWADDKGNSFYLTGEHIQLLPYSRIVHVERMHLPDKTPDNLVETSFEPDGSGTLMTMRMTLPDAEARDFRPAWSMGWTRATSGWKALFLENRTQHSEAFVHSTRHFGYPAWYGQLSVALPV